VGEAENPVVRGKERGKIGVNRKENCIGLLKDKRETISSKETRAGGLGGGDNGERPLVAENSGISRENKKNRQEVNKQRVIPVP